jgi:hypothetical protein
MQAPVVLWCDTLSKRLLGHPLEYFGVVGTIFMASLVVILSLMLDRFYDLRARDFMKKLWSRILSRKASIPEPAITSET